MPLSSFHYLTARAAASVSKKGLSHRDGVVHFFPEAVVKRRPGPNVHHGDE